MIHDAHKELNDGVRGASGTQPCLPGSRGPGIEMRRTHCTRRSESWPLRTWVFVSPHATHSSPPRHLGRLPIFSNPSFSFESARPACQRCCFSLLSLNIPPAARLCPTRTVTATATHLIETLV
ncbi:hypothetical protein SUGI_0823690 [Cryptomeria japonica]|nr:hypothetical protein SUGI_0823690 [Cryptomeria japonica]